MCGREKFVITKGDKCFLTLCVTGIAVISLGLLPSYFGNQKLCGRLIFHGDQSWGNTHFDNGSKLLPYLVNPLSHYDDF